MAEKDIAAIIAALCDVVMASGDYKARFSGHLTGEFGSWVKLSWNLCILVTVPET